MDVETSEKDDTKDTEGRSNVLREIWGLFKLALPLFLASASWVRDY